MNSNKKVIRFFTFLILGLFLVNLMSVALATPSDEVPKPAGDGDTIGTDIWNWFKSGATEGSEGGAVFSRILLIILVALLVYSVAGFLPFIGSGGYAEYIKVGVSIVVAILSFMYVTENTIRALLVNYEALGIMLTTIVPLVILITFIIQLNQNAPFTAHIVNPILTIGFFVYVLVRWFSVPENPLRIVYPITLVLLVLWLIFYKKIMKKFTEEEMETIADKYKREARLAKSKQETDAQVFEGGAGI